MGRDRDLYTILTERLGTLPEQGYFSSDAASDKSMVKTASGIIKSIHKEQRFAENKYLLSMIRRNSYPFASHYSDLVDHIRSDLRFLIDAVIHRDLDLKDFNADVSNMAALVDSFESRKMGRFSDRLYPKTYSAIIGGTVGIMMGAGVNVWAGIISGAAVYAVIKNGISINTPGFMEMSPEEAKKLNTIQSVYAMAKYIAKGEQNQKVRT